MGNIPTQNTLKSSDYPTANGPATLVEGRVLVDEYEWKVVAWMYRWPDGRLHLGLPTDSRMRALWQGLHAFRSYDRAGLDWRAGIQVRRQVAKILEATMNGDRGDEPTAAQEFSKETHMLVKEVLNPKPERTQCTAKTWPDGDGPRCPRKAAPGMTVCWFHTPEKMAERAAARQKKAEQAAALAAQKPAEQAQAVPPAPPVPTAPAFTSTPGISKPDKPANQAKPLKGKPELVSPKSQDARATGTTNRSTTR